MNYTGIAFTTWKNDEQEIRKKVCLLFNRDKKFPTELTKIILEIFHCTIFLTLFSEHILAIQEDAFFKIKKKNKNHW